MADTVCSIPGFDCAPSLELHASHIIASGPLAINRLGIHAQGNSYYYYINGRLVNEISTEGWQDWAWNQGDQGLYIGTAQADNAKVAFDEFNLWIFSH